MQAPYRDKEWLQAEVNRLGNLERVHKEYGWSKTNIYRWGKRLGVVAPEIDPQRKYENKEWLTKEFNSGRTDEDIAEEFDVTELTVEGYLKEFGLVEPEHFYLTGEGQKFAEETYKDKYWLYNKLEEYGSAAEVARQIGVVPTTIQYWARKFGYETDWEKDNPLYDDKNWLINQYEQGKTAKQVAEQCNVSQYTVSVANKRHGINIKEIHDKVFYPYKNKDWLIGMREKHGNGLQIAKATGYPVTSINRYIRKHKLRPIQKPKLVKTLNHDFFETIDAEEKAYWLGFLMADGNVYHRKDGSYEISLKLASRDRDSVLAFQKALGMSGEVEEFERKRRETTTYSTCIRFVSNKMAKDLAIHGLVPRKSRKEIIPKTVPDELLNHYIRGFFDGDGSASNGRVVISCSAFLYEQIKEVFIAIGVSPDAIRLNLNGKIYVLSVNRKKEVPLVVDFLYKNATIYMERKRKIYEEYGYLQTRVL